jgi:transcription elongation factor Elf1
MAKSKRGKILMNLPSRGRGTCPVCGSTRIKLLYDLPKSDGTLLKVCKKCQNTPQTKLDMII